MSSMNQFYGNELTWRTTNFKMKRSHLLTQTYKSGQNIGGIEVEGIW